MCYLFVPFLACALVAWSFFAFWFLVAGGIGLIDPLGLVWDAIPLTIPR